MLATRTMKARREGRCTLCGGPVHVGNLIGLVWPYPWSRFMSWCHCTCIIERHRSVMKLGDHVTDTPGGPAERGDR